MTALDRWLPFKFRRRSAEEKKSATRSAPSQDRSLSRPDPLWPMAAMHQWMTDVFDHPLREGGGSPAGNLEHWFGDFAPQHFSPRIDVSDRDDALTITAELPGMTKDDVELAIDDGMLTIRGEKRHDEKTNEKGVYRTERYYGYLQRSLPLPADLDQEHAEAKFEKGVLTVQFPKLESEGNGTRRIEISS